MHGLNLDKIKKGKTTLNAFIETVNGCNCKPNKCILMYSIHNEVKPVIGGIL